MHTVYFSELRIGDDESSLSEVKTLFSLDQYFDLRKVKNELPLYVLQNSKNIHKTHPLLSYYDSNIIVNFERLLMSFKDRFEDVVLKHCIAEDMLIEGIGRFTGKFSPKKKLSSSQLNSFKTINVVINNSRSESVEITVSKNLTIEFVYNWSRNLDGEILTFISENFHEWRNE